MSTTIRYLSKRTDLMPYDRLREFGLEIGSGAVESAVRQVVQLRFDGPGMRWGQDREGMLSLVCLRISGGWSALGERLQQWGRLAQPHQRMTPLAINPRSGRTRHRSTKVIEATERFLPATSDESRKSPSDQDKLAQAA